MVEERERFYSRLSTLPGIRPLPSVGNWILLEVEQPQELARKLNRRLSPGVVSVPRHVPGAVRIPVKDPKENEVLFNTIRDLVAGKHQHVLVAPDPQELP
jgi:histidinol-phosphate/aromatic aminotransferase/cobyric acid decarboxylase-like protein